MRLNEDKPMAELAISTIEQPSPVSVLDSTFYEEDSPSPVKKKMTAFRGMGIISSVKYPHKTSALMPRTNNHDCPKINTNKRRMESMLPKRRKI